MATRYGRYVWPYIERVNPEEGAFLAEFSASRSGVIYKSDFSPAKLYLSDSGYFIFRQNYTLSNKVQAHRFVWRYFNGPIPDRMVIDHINHVRNDNRLENLRCVTVAENNRNRKIRCY